jgi:hypothetical protein
MVALLNAKVQSSWMRWETLKNITVWKEEKEEEELKRRLERECMGKKSEF